MNIMNSLGKKLLFFDGGMGTLLQKKGLKAGELPETWNITHKDEITGIPKLMLGTKAPSITSR